jgi:hypothetical protein
MVKRCENGEIGIFSLCQPLDISSVTGRCQHCWSHAKAQRRKVRTKCSLSQHFILAPLREVKSWNRQTLESRQSGMFSSCLPVSLSPFHHPSFTLPKRWLSCSFPCLCSGTAFLQFPSRLRDFAWAKPRPILSCETAGVRAVKWPEKTREFRSCTGNPPWNLCLLQRNTGITVRCQRAITCVRSIGALCLISWDDCRPDSGSKHEPLTSLEIEGRAFNAGMVHCNFDACAGIRCTG